MSERRRGTAPEAQSTGRVAEVLEAGAGTVAFRLLSDATAEELLSGAGVSKTCQKRIFAEGRLVAEGAPLKAKDRICRGGTATLACVLPKQEGTPDDPSHAAEPAQVLCEDPFALVAAKPAGILVHSDGADGAEDTLTARVRRHLAEEGKPPLAQAVQRLDVETTGCVLFSLMPEFQGGFDALVAGHGMQKLYLAAVQGSLPEGMMRICAPIGRDRHDAHRMRISPGGKDAESLVWCVARAKGCSLALVELKSGRRHQIRVHLAGKGCPVLGDPLYGNPASQGADGLQLHCWRESFVHPVTGRHIVAEASWPESFNVRFSRRAIERGLAAWLKEHGDA